VAAFVFSLILSVFLAGIGWLLVGSRLDLKEEEAYNDLLNVLIYLLIVLPVNFLFVFTVLG
tara:strand:+ start:475 stop:657 length:183 start_codon:yes stop_codon:yes gene_type:complete